MKYTAAIAMLIAVVMVVIFSGCTGNTAASPAPTTPEQSTIAPTLQPTSVPDPYPNALALNVPVSFSSGKKTGEMTVTRYTFRPTYTWVDPSWNSPRQQAEAGQPLGTQTGYNTQRPHEGNTYLFVYLTVTGTGSEAVLAPSPKQIVVASEGKTYGYFPLTSAQTTVDGELGHEYDFLIGAGGTGGYVQPGASNTVKGFLIYEVPASISPDKVYVIAAADPQVQGVWKLA